MQNLASQPYLFIINVSSVIIHSIINTSFIYIKDFDTVSIGEEGIHHMPSYGPRNPQPPITVQTVEELSYTII